MYTGFVAAGAGIAFASGYAAAVQRVWVMTLESMEMVSKTC